METAMNYLPFGCQFSPRLSRHIGCFREFPKSAKSARIGTSFLVLLGCPIRQFDLGTTSSIGQQQYFLDKNSRFCAPIAPIAPIVLYSQYSSAVFLDGMIQAQPSLKAGCHIYIGFLFTYFRPHDQVAKKKFVYKRYIRLYEQSIEFDF